MVRATRYPKSVTLFFVLFSTQNTAKRSVLFDKKKFLNHFTLKLNSKNGYSILFPTILRISLNPRTTTQVGIAAWAPEKWQKFSALWAVSDNTAGWNSSPKLQVGGRGSMLYAFWTFFELFFNKIDNFDIIHSCFLEINRQSITSKFFKFRTICKNSNCFFFFLRF